MLEPFNLIVLYLGASSVYESEAQRIIINVQQIAVGKDLFARQGWLSKSVQLTFENSKLI